MQIGLHIGVVKRNSLEERLSALASYGIEAVHLNFKSLGGQYLPEKLHHLACQKLKRTFDQFRIAIASVSGTFNMAHPDAEVRRQGLQMLEHVCRVAAALDGPIVALCTGTRDPVDMWRHHPENDSPRAWQDFVDTMARAVEVARRYGVRLGIEPEVSNVVSSAEKARHVIDYFGSTHIGVIIDAANLFQQDTLNRMREILAQAFRLLGPFIVLAHAKDLDSTGHAGTVPAGKGVLDYDLYLTELKAVGYCGPLILHSLSEHDLAEAVAFLRAKLNALSKST